MKENLNIGPVLKSIRLYAGYGIINMDQSLSYSSLECCNDVRFSSLQSYTNNFNLYPSSALRLREWLCNDLKNDSDLYNSILNELSKYNIDFSFKNIILFIMRLNYYKAVDFCKEKKLNYSAFNAFLNRVDNNGFSITSLKRITDKFGLNVSSLIRIYEKLNNIEYKNTNETFNLEELTNIYIEDRFHKMNKTRNFRCKIKVTDNSHFQK